MTYKAKTRGNKVYNTYNARTHASYMLGSTTIGKQGVQELFFFVN